MTNQVSNKQDKIYSLLLKYQKQIPMKGYNKEASRLYAELLLCVKWK